MSLTPSEAAGRQAESRQHSRTRRPLLTLALFGTLAFGCARLQPYRTPLDVDGWQDPTPPHLSMAEKARVYQQRLEAWHQMPDGTLRYRFHHSQARDDVGNHADGSYFLGIYLASQALRYAATGDLEAREQLLRALEAARLYTEVSGVRGLLARYVSLTPPRGDPDWRVSTSRPGYAWRSDVSKDQYAGFVHGLGVTLAVIHEAEIRAEVAALASAIADHLIENELRIVDWDGEPTTYGDLRGRRLGVPFGVDASIDLAIARTAAVATGEARHREFYDRLVAEGYPGVTYWSHVPLASTKRVNETMAFLALYPLLMLEDDAGVLAHLRRAARRTWRHVQGEQNAFLAFVAAVATSGVEATESDAAVAEARQSLLWFPDRKLGRPVDLTRPGFDFPQRLLKTRDGLPRSRRPIPLYLRTRGSSMWTVDPYRLVGGLTRRGETEFSGIDYLNAYWMGRYHGFVRADD